MVPLLTYVTSGILIATVAIIAVLRILQVAFTPKMLEHTMTFAVRVPYDSTILILSCLLLLISLVQLSLTPSLFTGGSCNCSWDVRPLWVKICHWAGSAVNAGAAIMTAVVCIATFLGPYSDSTTFPVCSHLSCGTEL